MTTALQTVSTRSRSAWRRWLARHHASSRGIWLEFYKRHGAVPSITYAEALDEALCFGWIDSIVKRIDDERYVRKFTPRTNSRRWSPTNLRHMRRLISEGKMTDAGLRVLGVPLVGTEAKTAVEVERKTGAAKMPDSVPAFVESAITGNPQAASFWSTLAPGYRRRYLAWILNAKVEATRHRRLAEVIRCLASGTKSILK